MAINVTFNGATIYKPGAYSKTNIDLGGAFAVGPAGLIAVFGEADAGPPGSAEINIANNRFSPAQLVQIRNKYRSGPIADSAAFLFAPASDAAIPNGAQVVWYYKTNESTVATLAVATAYGTVESTEYGVGGNRLTYTSTLVGETPATETGAAFDATAVTGGETFTYTSEGDTTTTNVFTASAAAITVAAVQTDLDDITKWSLGAVPTGATFTAGGTDIATTITVTQTSTGTEHQNGYGKSFELTASAGLGLVDGASNALVEPSVTLTIDSKRDDIQESDTLGGNIVMTVGNDGSVNANTAATITIDSDSIILLEDAVAVYTLPKDSYTTIKQVVDEIDLKPGWGASVANSAFNQASPDSLDEVAALGAFSASGGEPARTKSDADDVDFFFTNSSQARMTGQSATGLPDASIETFLAGGVKGATTGASIIDALDKFTKFHVNSIVPLFSRDATDDISDSLTDAASTYTIDAVHQAVKTHISLMKTTKRRSERQGYLSQKATFVDCKTKAGDLADGRLQLFIQDVRQTNAQGTIQFFQPWVGSCLMAGARGGAPVGEPLTFKFMNASGIRHTGTQPMSTAPEDAVTDFDPDLQSDEAIQAGITFMENPQTGGFRIVVDNTTYGVDDNFVFNRGNVLYAADIVAFNLRNQLENRFVGKKNTVAVADVIGAATAALNAFLSAGITVSTGDAPAGFKSLNARIEGNTIFVDVIVKLVEGIDFVLSEITIQRATNS